MGMGGGGAKSPGDAAAVWVWWAWFVARPLFVALLLLCQSDSQPLSPVVTLVIHRRCLS